MRFIDGQSDEFSAVLDGSEEREEVGELEALGRDVEKAVAAGFGAERSQDAAILGGGLGAGEIGAGNVAFAEFADCWLGRERGWSTLVLHEGDQRRNDDTKPISNEGRDLVTQGLPSYATKHLLDSYLRLASVQRHLNLLRSNGLHLHEIYRRKTNHIDDCGILCIRT